MFNGLSISLSLTLFVIRRESDRFACVRDRQMLLLLLQPSGLLSSPLEPFNNVHLFTGRFGFQRSRGTRGRSVGGEG